MRIRFHELAQLELNWAIGYCELESPGRGARLLEDFDQTLQWAGTFPHGGTAIEDLDSPLEVRGFLLGRFEYTVVMAVLPEELVIVAVPHHKREPGYWRDRLEAVK